MAGSNADALVIFGAGGDLSLKMLYPALYALELKGVLDIPVLGRVGLSASPCDGVEDVRTRVDYVSRAGGGHGAAREFVELVLKAQGRWEALLDHE